jgi:hypothetical protein
VPIHTRTYIQFATKRIGISLLSWMEILYLEMLRDLAFASSSMMFGVMD